MSCSGIFGDGVFTQYGDRLDIAKLACVSVRIVEGGLYSCPGKVCGDIATGSFSVTIGTGLEGPIEGAVDIR